MAKKYEHITLSDRTLIQTQLQQGFKPSAIAASMGRPRSCITRELARNGWKAPSVNRPVGRPAIAGGYLSSRAHLRARKLTTKPRVERKLVVGNLLWNKVSDGLKQGLSPEQISGTLRRMSDPIRLCHETIYQAIYVMPKGELRTEMIALLRFGHSKRQPRARGVDRRGQIPHMTSIDQRPADIAERLVSGDWEGDHIKGAGNRSQVGTLVERKTRYVALVKLDNGTAQETTKGFGTILQRFDVDLRRSLTYDQGREMAQHAKLTESIGIKVYFAHPHSPWERGQNENTNGLLRQYLPKGTDLSLFSQQALDDIAWKLNTRPRKALGWKCPAELFLKTLLTSKLTGRINSTLLHLVIETALLGQPLSKRSPRFIRKAVAEVGRPLVWAGCCGCMRLSNALACRMKGLKMLSTTARLFAGLSA